MTSRYTLPFSLAHIILPGAMLGGPWLASTNEKNVFVFVRVDATMQPFQFDIQTSRTPIYLWVNRKRQPRPDLPDEAGTLARSVFNELVQLLHEQLPTTYLDIVFVTEINGT